MIWAGAYGVGHKLYLEAVGVGKIAGLLAGAAGMGMGLGHSSR